MFLPWGPLGAGQGVAKWAWSKPMLASFLRPIQKVYIHEMGYRQMGLLKDDIIQAENPYVQKASLHLPLALTWAGVEVGLGEMQERKGRRRRAS